MKSFSVGEFIVSFAIIGGFIGGLILGIGALLMDLKGLEKSLFYLFMPLIPAFFGVIVGFIPALLTAIWLNFRKIRLHKWQNYCEIFLAGFIITLVCEICVLGFGIFEKYMLLPAILGGISAIFTSLILLPKTSFYKEK